MDRISDVDPDNNADCRIVMDAETVGRLKQWDRRPLLFFTAHLANWEIPASVGRTLGLDIVIPVRRQHLDLIADYLAQARPGGPGPTFPLMATQPSG
jgi:lauroyl/myristoyl acyltransferase